MFLRTELTVIEGLSWPLPITGRVENPVPLMLEDIRDNYPSRDQYITLACISGRVATDLISTTSWTGASLQEVLADVRPTAGARYLTICTMRSDANLRDCGRYDSPHLGQACLGVMAG